MKKNKQIISIILSVFILNVFVIMPAAYAASTIESILETYDAKGKIQNFLYDTGRNFLYNFSNSLKSDKPASGNLQQNLKGKRIVIDPGHGGHNPGAVRGDLQEADNNLAVALKLKDILKKQGAEVIMTRETDVSLVSANSALREELQARVDITNKSNADIFVSIHTNSSEDTSVNGAMTFYYNDASKRLANDVQAGMINSIKASDKGTAFGNYLVLRNNSVPAILVEMGFISNKAEALKLNEDGYRNKIAQGLASGITNYFNGV